MTTLPRWSALSSSRATAKLPPGPRGVPFFGEVFKPRGDAIGYLSRIARDYGDIVFVRFLGVPMCLISRPEYIESVLTTQSHNFEKSKDYRALRRVLGAGLLTSEGEAWRRQRRLIQPAFYHERVEAYAEVMVEYTERMVASWQDGQTRDVHADMMRLTLDIVAKTLFGADVSREAEDVGASLHLLMGRFMKQAGYAFLLPSRIPLPTTWRILRAVRRLNQVIYEIICKRRASGQRSSDLLSMLLDAQDEHGAVMTDRQLQDEIMTLFLAGHETTATALSWTWLLLAQNPDVEAKLATELQCVLGGRVPGVCDLPRLSYAELVLKEAMRLYPPVWVIGRRALAPFHLGEYQLPARTNVVMLQYLMHRDPRFFPEPERFDPERWRENDPRYASLPRFAYFPFGGGPRVCVGAGFGMMEGVLLLAAVAQRFRLSLVSDQTIEMLPSVTLRPKNGIRVTLARR